MTEDKKWLVGIDIDGTLVHDDGYLSENVLAQINRVRDLGHHVFVATGRAASNAFPVIKQLGIDSGHAVCSNGAVTIRLDASEPKGYAVHDIKTFDPAEVLARLIETVPNAHLQLRTSTAAIAITSPPKPCPRRSERRNPSRGAVAPPSKPSSCAFSRPRC